MLPVESPHDKTVELNVVQWLRWSSEIPSAELNSDQWTDWCDCSCRWWTVHGTRRWRSTRQPVCLLLRTHTLTHRQTSYLSVLKPFFTVMITWINWICQTEPTEPWNIKSAGFSQNLCFIVKGQQTSCLMSGKTKADSCSLWFKHLNKVFFTVSNVFCFLSFLIKSFIIL